MNGVSGAHGEESPLETITSRHLDGTEPRFVLSRSCYSSLSTSRIQSYSFGGTSLCTPFLRHLTGKTAAPDIGMQFGDGAFSVDPHICMSTVSSGRSFRL